MFSLTIVCPFGELTYTDEKVPHNIFGQVFDQVFGQDSDQVLGEGKNHKYSVQYYADQGKTKKLVNKNLTNPLNLV